MAVNIDYSAGRGQAGMLQNLLNIQQQGYQQMAAKERQKQEQMNQLFRAGGGFLEQRRAEGEARDIAALDAQTQQALQSAEADYLAGLQKYNASLEEAGSFEQKKAVREDLENFMKSYQAQRSAITGQAEERKKAYYDTGFLGIGRDAGTLGGEFKIPGLYSAEGMGDITKAPSEAVAAAQAKLAEAEQLRRRAQQKTFMDAEYLSRQAFRNQPTLQQRGVESDLGSKFRDMGRASDIAGTRERKRSDSEFTRGRIGELDAQLRQAEQGVPDAQRNLYQTSVEELNRRNEQARLGVEGVDKFVKESEADIEARRAALRNKAGRLAMERGRKLGETLGERDLLIEDVNKIESVDIPEVQGVISRGQNEIREIDQKITLLNQAAQLENDAEKMKPSVIRTEYSVDSMGGTAYSEENYQRDLSEYQNKLRKSADIREFAKTIGPAQAGENLNKLQERKADLEKRNSSFQTRLSNLEEEISSKRNRIGEINSGEIPKELDQKYQDYTIAGEGDGSYSDPEVERMIRDTGRDIDAEELRLKNQAAMMSRENQARQAFAERESADRLNRERELVEKAKGFLEREQERIPATKEIVQGASERYQLGEDLDLQKRLSDRMMGDVGQIAEEQLASAAGKEALSKRQAEIRAKDKAMEEEIQKQKGFLSEAESKLAGAEKLAGEEYVQLPSGRYVKRSGTASAMEEEKRLKLRGEAREDRLESLSLDLARNSNDVDAVNAFMEANNLPEGFRLMLNSTVESNAYKQKKTEQEKQRIILNDTYNRLVALGQFEQAFDFGQKNGLIGKNVKYTDNKAIELTKEMVRSLSDENEAGKILDQAGISGADRELHMAIVRQNKGKVDRERAINLSNSPAITKKQRFDVLQQAFPSEMGAMTFQQYENVDEQLNTEFRRASVTGGSLSPQLFEKLGITDPTKQQQMNDFATRSYYDSVYEKDQNKMLLELEGALKSSDVVGEDGKMIPSKAAEVVDRIIGNYPGAAKHFGYDSKYFREKLITDTKKALAAERASINEATLKGEKLKAEIAKAQGAVLPSDFFDAASKTWSDVYSGMIEKGERADLALAAANSAVFFMRQGLDDDAKGGYEGVVDYLKEMGFLVDQVPNKNETADTTQEEKIPEEKAAPDNRTLAEVLKQVSKDIGETVNAVWNATTGTIDLVTDSGKVITERMIYDTTGGFLGKSAEQISREQAAQ